VLGFAVPPQKALADEAVLQQGLQPSAPWDADDDDEHRPRAGLLFSLLLAVDL